MSYVSSLPSTVRHLISSQTIRQPTYGFCKGFLQANIAIVPSKFADAFEKFCKLNPSACPLLYRSEKGEFSAPPLAKGSDIRTDISKYWVHKDGKFHEELHDLKSFVWEDMATFYIGCSFGMEDGFERAGLPLPKNKNVSMYVTNVKCNPSNPFTASMVVSMRSVPVKLVQEIFEATFKLDCVHGAPIHIGHPAGLGIKDIKQIDYGDPTDIEENEIPLFWACGATATRAIQSAAFPLCFSHAPGCMFICDVKTESFQEACRSPYEGLSPRVVQLCDSAQIFSVLSDSAKTRIEALETLLLNDIGTRGVEHMSIKDELLKSSLRLYQASTIGITTGFPCFPQDPVAEETDGIPGALSIAKALCALGKNVSLIVDRRNEAIVNTTIQQCLASGILTQDIPVLVYERKHDWERDQEALQFLYPEGISGKPRFEHLVSIERAGPTKDGTYRNAKGMLISQDLVAPVEDLFRLALQDGRVATTGIGDGGNELGMGKVKEKVAKFVKNGECIACEVCSDYLITAGVSNWGGYALAAALHLLSTCPIHLRYVRRGLVPLGEEERSREDFLNNVNQEEEILAMLVREGVRDGLTGKRENFVDGFAFYPHHANQIKQIQQVAQTMNSE